MTYGKRASNKDLKIRSKFSSALAGFVRVMEILQRYEIEEFHFPGLERHEIQLSVLESHRK